MLRALKLHHKGWSFPPPCIGAAWGISSTCLHHESHMPTQHALPTRPKNKDHTIIHPMRCTSQARPKRPNKCNARNSFRPHSVSLRSETVQPASRCPHAPLKKLARPDSVMGAPGPATSWHCFFFVLAHLVPTKLSSDSTYTANKGPTW